MTTSTATQQDDPNGWVKNPPSVFVQIQGTSRESVNGQLGLVLGFTPATSSSSSASSSSSSSQEGGRYTILLTTQNNTSTHQHVSLRPEHLSRANWLQQLQGQYQLVTNDPRVRQQALEWLQRVERTTGLKWTHVLVALLIVLLVSFYVLGFSRTLLWLSFGIMVLLVIAPDLADNKPWRVTVRNVPVRIQTLVRQSQLPFGKQIADNRYLLFLLVALVMAIFVRGMMLPTTPKQQLQQQQYGVDDMIVPPTATADDHGVLSGSGSDGGGYYKSHDSSLVLERYYKLGFDDAANDRPFGSSLPAEKPSDFGLKMTTKTSSSSGHDSHPYRHEQQQQVLDDPLAFEDHHHYHAPPPPRRKGTTTLLSMSNAMSAFYLYRTVDELGRGAGAGPWTWQQLAQSVRTMPAWRMALLGLSVYRLLSAVMGV